jgi:phosphonate transport system substrate-binding protein
MLTYSAEFRAVAVVADKGPIKTAADLKDQAVLGLSPTSLVTQWGQHWLKQNGLNQPMCYVSASDSVAHLVLEGQASAGFTSMANYQSLSPEIQTQLKLLVVSEPMAGRVYVLNQRQLPKKAAIDIALASYAQSEEGRAYFAKYKLNGFRQLLPKELNAMDPYAAEVRQSLK